MDNTPPVLSRLLYAPTEVQALLGLSRATVFRLLRARRLEGRKIGSRTVITTKSIEQFIANLPAAVGASPPSEPQGEFTTDPEPTRAASSG
jgi:hypothetical protein